MAAWLMNLDFAAGAIAAAPATAVRSQTMIAVGSGVGFMFALLWW